MFLLRKSFRFEAAHQLVHHGGKCAHLHGHSYKLEVQLASPTLQKSGSSTNMVQDFEHISAVVRTLVKEFLDHRNLNETLDSDSPTAEFIAQWTYERLHKKLPQLVAVTIRETESSSVTYAPGIVYDV